MGRQEIQNESHESSESSYFPSSSCHPCGPHPWPASVQRRSILLLQQQQWQLCQQGSLAVSLVAPLTVAAAVTTASLLTTTVSTATSRTREDSTTREVSTARALT